MSESRLPDYLEHIQQAATDACDYLSLSAQELPPFPVTTSAVPSANNSSLYFSVRMDSKVGVQLYMPMEGALSQVMLR